MIRSSSSRSFFVTFTGLRLLKMVPSGIPSPIFSAMRNLPVGVFKLPFLVPIPKREVEMTYLPNILRPSFSVRSCFGTEIWIFADGLFFIVDPQ